jgi:hypothetical protein|nr:MAG TPA: hypothetical protein [Caudoviricetes sp.]
MNERYTEIEKCPFRTVIKKQVIQHVNVETTDFMECSKEKCPAFEKFEGHTFSHEICKMIGR